MNLENRMTKSGLFTKESELSDIDNLLDFSLLYDAYNRKTFDNLKHLVDEIAKNTPLSLRPKTSATIKQYKKDLNQLILNLYVAWSVSEYLYIAISLDNNKYRKGTRLNSLFMSYRGTVRMLESLKTQGYVEVYKGFYDRKRKIKRRTRIRATEKLRRIFRENSKVELGELQVESAPIILKDKNKDILEISENLKDDQYEQRLRNIELINSFHGSATWQLDMSELEFINEYIVKRRIEKTKQAIKSKKKGKSIRVISIYPPNPMHKKFYRVFNEDFSHGGRFYGPWPQRLPGDAREKILINGEKTVELDYNSIHPTLLYHEIAAPLTKDPYIIDGYGREYRSVMKLLLNTALNAKTAENAYSGFRKRACKEKNILINFKKCLKDEWLIPALEAIKETHKPIAKYIGTGTGSRLQKVDSDIAELVLLTLAEKGIHAIPVHDSFIVQKRHEETLRMVMKWASKEICGFEIGVSNK